MMEEATVTMDGVEATTPVPDPVVKGVDEELGNASAVTILNLESTIAAMNADFGEKRAKFKKLFMQKEEELEYERKSRENVEAQVKKLQDELNEAKSQVTITEFTKDNEIEDLKQRGQHEIATLHKLYEESIHENRMKYEMELHRLKIVNNKLEAELSELRPQLAAAGGSEVSPGAVFSAMTKSLARKINSTMSTSNDSLHDIEDSHKQKASKYAHEDAEMLRSLVVQLEEELSALKDKVRNSDDQLAALQNAQASLVKGNDALTLLLQEQNVQGVLNQLDDKLRETRSGLEAEKSSRADLEMYVALVNAQKTLLQEDLEKTKSQLRELRQLHEEEKKSHEDLKETWKQANEQFVQTQDAYQTTIHRMKAIMTRQQLDQLKNNDFVLHENPRDTSASYVQTEEVQDIPQTPVRCQECEKHETANSKLRNELQKAAKLRNEMEEDWCRISQDMQAKLSTMEEQIGTYEMVLQELNSSCQQSLQDMEKQIKRLIPEREKLQRKLDQLQRDNDNLRGKHVAHSEQLQREDISLPSDILELQELLLRTKEELISVKVGKEEIESELKFYRARVSTEEQEKKIIEENLHADIKHLRDQLRFREDDVRKRDLAIHELKSSPGRGDRFNDIVKERDKLKKDVMELTDKISTLRKELSNSEELQKDLIALSKSLQVELERVRQAETEVRWQHPDDIRQCNGNACKKHLSDSMEKHNCCHCGRIFCSDCLKHSVCRGNRDYRVCEFCHTVLAHDSAPYFSTEAPHSPD